MKTNKILHGDCLTQLKTLPDESVDMCMTSPPYWALRDYGVEGQLGLEPTPEEYINKLCDIFDQVKRVLKPEGSCWVNLGDTYSSQRWTGKGEGQPMNKMKDGHRDINPIRQTDLPPKCLVQIPSRFALEMCNRGWVLRNDIIWYKPSCMPSSTKDRFTVDYEHLFFFVKQPKYYFKTQYEPLASCTQKRYDAVINKTERYDAVINKTDPAGKAQSAMEILVRTAKKGLPRGRIKRCVWKINPQKYRTAHFATYPEKLCESPIDAGCPVGGIVLDPFFGAGTTGLVALRQGKKYIGVELNPEYIEISKKRLAENTFFG